MNDNSRSTGIESDCLVRSQIYRCLARAFDYPAKNGEGIEYIAEALPWFLKLESEKLQEAAAGVIDSVHSNGLESLQQEYVRLFDYRPACPLQESAHSNSRTAMDLTGSLMEFYAKSGLSCRSSMAPDHLVAELELMHYLCFHGAQDTEKDPRRWWELQREFLASHILSWVPAFASRLASVTDTPYRLLGDLIQGFMDYEATVTGRSEAEEKKIRN